jgi:hypothetical protein
LAQVWLLITSLTKLTVTGPLQLSLTPVTNVVFGAGISPVQLTVIGAGQVKTGGVWSFTVIICVQFAELPQPSVAR